MSLLRVAFLDVGQGDSCVLYDPEAKEAVIVDCSDAQAMLDFLTAENIRYLHAIIITHAHSDHYGGTVHFLEEWEKRGLGGTLVFRWEDARGARTNPKLLVDDDNLTSEQHATGYRSFLNWLVQPTNKERRSSLESLLDNPQNRLLKAINNLHPKHKDWQEIDDKGNLNNFSIVLRVSEGQTSALLTGDIEPFGWAFLRKNHPEALQNNVLKFPHHGVWRNANVNELLDDVKPQIAVVSVGTKNSYGHPSIEVLQALKSKGIKILCTQATLQCGANLPGVMEKVGKKLKQKLKTDCPCAGTVIIELGPQLRLIKPDLNFHHQVVEILPNHQCV